MTTDDHAIDRQMAATIGSSSWRIHVGDGQSDAQRLRRLRLYNAMLRVMREKGQRMERHDPEQQQQPPAAAIPTDAYSVAYRQLCDHPEAVRSSSTLTLADFFGRSESWIVESFWLDGSATVFLQRMSAAGAFRLVLPAIVTTTIAAQRDRVVTGRRKKTARAIVATRRARGDRLGNSEALVKARAARQRRSNGRKVG